MACPSLRSGDQGQRSHTVQCYFDDAITVGNVSEALRETFAPERWRRVEAEYTAGQLSVEESNRQQFALVKASRTEIEESVSRMVVVKAGFRQFVGYCRRAGLDSPCSAAASTSI